MTVEISMLRGAEAVSFGEGNISGSILARARKAPWRRSILARMCDCTTEVRTWEVFGSSRRAIAGIAEPRR